MENGIIPSGQTTSAAHSISVVKARGQKSDIDPNRLGKVLGVTPEVALQTMRMTERYYPRNTTDISLNCRHYQDDAIIRYGRLKWKIYSDSGFASGSRGKKIKKQKRGVSVRGNTCFQASAT